MTNKVTSVSEVNHWWIWRNAQYIWNSWSIQSKEKKETFCQLATFGCAKAAAQDCKMVVKTTPICSQSIGCLQGIRPC